jgi:hypothetical protein
VPVRIELSWTLYISTTLCEGWDNMYLLDEWLLKQ